MLKLAVTDSRHKTLLAYLDKDGPTSMMSHVYILLAITMEDSRVTTTSPFSQTHVMVQYESHVGPSLSELDMCHMTSRDREVN
jgi:hypothetical protein